MAVILDGASGVTHNLESDPMSVFYQSMPSTYKLAERNNLQKIKEEMLNYSLSCSCSLNMISFQLKIKQ
jgi:hypothetical protein